MLGKIEGRRRRGSRGWDGYTSLTPWTWIWANSRREWRTEEPGVLQSLASQSRTWHRGGTTGTVASLAPVFLLTVCSRKCINIYFISLCSKIFQPLFPNSKVTSTFCVCVLHQYSSDRYHNQHELGLNQRTELVTDMFQDIYFNKFS